MLRCWPPGLLGVLACVVLLAGAAITIVLVAGRNKVSHENVNDTHEVTVLKNAQPVG